MTPKRTSRSTRRPTTRAEGVATLTARPRCSLRWHQASFRVSGPPRRLKSYQWSSRRIRSRASSDRSTRAPPRSIWSEVATPGQLRRKVFAEQVGIQADADRRRPRPARSSHRLRRGSRRVAAPARVRPGFRRSLRPSTRTSLGHLIRASRPVQSETTSAVAIAPSAVNQARPESPGRVARHQAGAAEKAGPTSRSTIEAGPSRTALGGRGLRSVLRPG